MDKAINKIRCPNCGEEIDVNALLYHELDNELRNKYQSETAEQRRQFQLQQRELEEQRQKLAQSRAEQALQVRALVAETLKGERETLTKALRKSLEDEQQERVKMLETELQQKSLSLREFNKAKSQIERLKREKDELADDLNAKAEQRLSAALRKEKSRIRKEIDEHARLQLSERDKIIEELHSQLKVAQRKAEQSATQLMGEVQELAIEDWLRRHYPLDVIDEVKKGARGADCLQTVNTRNRRNCGTIYYESKRAKSFQPVWVEKFRSDIRERGADIGVLVTESMPADMPRMGLRNGVWVCTVEEFKGLSAVLRESIVRFSSVVAAQVNKGDKMEMLYNYLTGDGFRHQIEAIVEGFTQMQSDLETEKRSMTAIWRKREKQIQKVLLSTTGMYGDVKGIAGTAIQSVPMLELPVPETSDGDDENG